MDRYRGSDVILLRHVLSPEDYPITRALQQRLTKEAPLPIKMFRSIAGPELGQSIALLLKLLCRQETAALFILDGEEHLTIRQVSALRRCETDPDSYPKLLVGSLKNTWLEPISRKGENTTSPRTQSLRLQVKVVASHLTEGTRRKGRTAQRPILERLALPKTEWPEAENLAVCLLTARSEGMDATAERLPPALIFALLDLVTVLGRGSCAHILVLDHIHLAEAPNPRTLDAYTSPARALATLPARTVYTRRIKAEKLTRVRQLPDPARKRRVKPQGISSP